MRYSSLELEDIISDDKILAAIPVEGGNPQPLLAVRPPLSLANS